MKRARCVGLPPAPSKYPLLLRPSRSSGEYVPIHRGPVRLQHILACRWRTGSGRTPRNRTCYCPPILHPALSPLKAKIRLLEYAPDGRNFASILEQGLFLIAWRSGLNCFHVFICLAALTSIQFLPPVVTRNPLLHDSVVRQLGHSSSARRNQHGSPR